jgi:thiol-disulfide isomerase/thioredoxin
MKELARAGLLLLAAWIPVAPLAAAELRPFVAASMAEIRAAHAGRPFVLALWSIDCAHCPAELAQLGSLQRKHPQLEIVLVSTDTPDDAQALSATLARHGLGSAEAWVYADAFGERLRYAIDPRWGGELPRTYLFGRDRSVRGVSGRLPDGELERWVAVQTAAGAKP